MKIFNRQGRALLIATVIMAVLVGCGGDNGGTTPSHTHTWGDWVVTTPATCDAHGVETRICTQDNRHSEIRATTTISPNTVVKGTLIDSRDGKEYKTIKICRQTWMAEDLNYAATSGSWCGPGQGLRFLEDREWNEPWYQNINMESCGIMKTGRFYDWNTARAVCPSGYRLPDEDDWNRLFEMVGSFWVAGLKLRATGGRYGGTDDYGFSAKLSGIGNGYIYNEGEAGYWWTATEKDNNNAYVEAILAGDVGRMNGLGEDGSLVIEIDRPKEYQLTVRCIKDE